MSDTSSIHSKEFSVASKSNHAADDVMGGLRIITVIDTTSCNKNIYECSPMRQKFPALKWERFLLKKQKGPGPGRGWSSRDYGSILELWAFFEGIFFGLQVPWIIHFFLVLVNKCICWFIPHTNVFHVACSQFSLWLAFGWGLADLWAHFFWERRAWSLYSPFKIVHQ